MAKEDTKKKTESSKKVATNQSVPKKTQTKTVTKKTTSKPKEIEKVKENKSSKKWQVSFLIFCIIILIFVISTIFIGKRTLVIENVLYKDVKKLTKEFENKYYDYSIIKLEGFTKYAEMGYLRLYSTNSFDDLYVRRHIYLYEGSYPKNNNEVVLPKYLMTESKFASIYGSYKIGDTIKLNSTQYYTKVEVKPQADEKDYIESEIKYSVGCSKVDPYTKEDENYKEYTIVGFYDYVLYKDLNKDSNEFVDLDRIKANYINIDIITYLDKKSLKDDDRVIVNFNLKGFSYIKKNLKMKLYDIYVKYSRNEESILSTYKTCNDDIDISYSNDFENKASFNLNQRYLEKESK